MCPWEGLQCLLQAWTPYLSLRGVSTVGCPLGKVWWESGGETLGGAANEVAVVAVPVRSSPSCLTLSSGGCPGAPSPFHSWGRSVGHTAAVGERKAGGWRGLRNTGASPPYPWGRGCQLAGRARAVGLGLGFGGESLTLWEGLEGPRGLVGLQADQPLSLQVEQVLLLQLLHLQELLLEGQLLVPQCLVGGPRGRAERGAIRLRCAIWPPPCSYPFPGPLSPRRCRCSV